MLTAPWQWAGYGFIWANLNKVKKEENRHLRFLVLNIFFDQRKKLPPPTVHTNVCIYLQEKLFHFRTGSESRARSCLEKESSKIQWLVDNFLQNLNWFESIQGQKPKCLMFLSCTAFQNILASRWTLAGFLPGWVLHICAQVHRLCLETRSIYPWRGYMCTIPPCSRWYIPDSLEQLASQLQKCECWKTASSNTCDNLGEQRRHCCCSWAPPEMFCFQSYGIVSNALEQNFAWLYVMRGS